MPVPLPMSRLTKLRTRAFFAQQCRCIYCNLPIWEEPYKERFAAALGVPPARLHFLRSSAEHLVARQDGGPDAAANVAAACWWCNWKRHAHRSASAPGPMQFRAEVQRLMAARLWHPAARWVSGSSGKSFVRRVDGLACEGRPIR